MVLVQLQLKDFLQQHGAFEIFDTREVAEVRERVVQTSATRLNMRLPYV
jgi:hypothetical protein